MTKLKKKNPKRIMKQLSKLTIVLAFLLMPSIVNTKTIVVDTIEAQVTQPKLKWPSGAVHSMVQECYRYLNASSIQNFGAPIIPFLGLNQCSCVVDKIRLRFKYATEYMKEITSGRSGKIISECSVECILEGAMGEATKKAFLEAKKKDNKTKSDESPPAIESSNELPKKENKTPVTWDDLINK